MSVQCLHLRVTALLVREVPEAETIFASEGCAAVFFTLLAADNYWDDIFDHMHPGYENNAAGENHHPQPSHHRFIRRGEGGDINQSILQRRSKHGVEVVPTGVPGEREHAHSRVDQARQQSWKTLTSRQSIRGKKQRAIWKLRTVWRRPSLVLSEAKSWRNRKCHKHAVMSLDGRYATTLTGSSAQ